MSTVTNNLLRAATIVVAIASGSAAVAQTTSQATSTTSTGATATASTTKTATSGNAAQNAVAATTVAATTVAASKAQQPTGLTRAQVQAEFLEARKNGTLLQTEADFDVAQTRKHVAN